MGNADHISGAKWRGAERLWRIVTAHLRRLLQGKTQSRGLAAKNAKKKGEIKSQRSSLFAA
jgi:hypothetical protein